MDIEQKTRIKNLLDIMAVALTTYGNAVDELESMGVGIEFINSHRSPVGPPEHAEWTDTCVVYKGIHKLAEIAEKEITIPEDWCYKPVTDQRGFMHNGVYFRQILKGEE